LALNPETFSDVWRFSNGLAQHIKSFTVLSSDSFDLTGVEEIFAELVVGFTFREGALLN